jgi:hypothetical protein
MNQVIVRYKVKPERSPLSEVAAFEQFQHEINDRCEEQPGERGPRAGLLPDPRPLVRTG